MMARSPIVRTGIARQGIARAGIARPRAITRYIKEWAGGQWADGLTHTTDASTPFYLGVEIVGTNESYERIFALVTENGDERITLEGKGGTTNALKVATNGYSPGEGSIQYNDGKIHAIRVDFNPDSGEVDVFVDGAIDYSFTHTNPANLRNKTFSVSVGSGRNSTVTSYGAGYIGRIIRFDLNGTIYDLDRESIISEPSSDGSGDPLTLHNFGPEHVAKYTYQNSPPAWVGPGGTPYLEYAEQAA